MSTVKDRLKNKMLITAGNDDLQHLRVLIDESSYKLAQKVYKSYISEMDFSKFHAFMLEFDRLLSRFGGKPLPPPEEQPQPQQGGKPQQKQPQNNRPAPKPQAAPPPPRDEIDE